MVELSVFFKKFNIEFDFLNLEENPHLIEIINDNLIIEYNQKKYKGLIFNQKILIYEFTNERESDFIQNYCKLYAASVVTYLSNLKRKEFPLVCRTMNHNLNNSLALVLTQMELFIEIKEEITKEDLLELRKTFNKCLDDLKIVKEVCQKINVIHTEKNNIKDIINFIHLNYFNEAKINISGLDYQLNTELIALMFYHLINNSLKFAKNDISIQITEDDSNFIIFYKDQGTFVNVDYVLKKKLVNDGKVTTGLIIILNHLMEHNGTLSYCKEQNHFLIKIPK